MSSNPNNESNDIDIHERNDIPHLPIVSNIENQMTDLKINIEDRQENLSEEGNEFVVDLDNTTPIKENKNFQFDGEKNEKANDEPENNQENYSKDFFDKYAMNNSYQVSNIKSEKVLEHRKSLNEKVNSSLGDDNESIEDTYKPEIDQSNHSKIETKDEIIYVDETFDKHNYEASNEKKQSPDNLGSEEDLVENSRKNNSNDNIEKTNNIDNNIKNEILQVLYTNENQNQVNGFKNNSVPNISRVLINDIEPKIKFEKLLNTNLDAKMQFRICIVGDSNVGKTSLLTRYCDDTFKSSMTNTIGVDFRVLMLKYNDVNIKLQIWDTAGQERFKSISVNYFKSANGFIFVYDITNKNTLENLNNWFDIVSQHNKNSVCNFVIGNKSDLEDKRQVSIEQGKEFAFGKKSNFMETSAKSSKNVDVAFEIFTYKLIEYFNLQNQLLSDNLSENLSDFSQEDGKKFKIDDVYDENTMSKKKKKQGCKC